jgi:hypothetical protein
VARPTRTATRAPRPRTNARPLAEHVDRTPPVFTAKVTIDRARVDVPMLVLRGEWLKAIGFPIGATAFLSTDKRGGITLTRMGLTRPRKLCVVKSEISRRWAEAHPMTARYRSFGVRPVCFATRASMRGPTSSES